jgi:hypothetical protein
MKKSLMLMAFLLGSAGVGTLFVVTSSTGVSAESVGTSTKIVYDTSTSASTPDEDKLDFLSKLTKDRVAQGCLPAGSPCRGGGACCSRLCGGPQGNSYCE